MKKLLIAAVALAMGIAAQAANVNWSTGALYLPNADGTWSTTKATDTTAGTWNIALTFFTQSGDPFAAGGATSDDSITALTSALSGSATGFDNDTTYLVNVILTYENGGKKYTKEWEDISFTTKKTGGTTANMQNTTTFSEQLINTSAPLGWTITNVPEPTSGLLMLLGMAGLALRRRRA